MHIDKKVSVGFSGGKDSTAAIILLKEQGYRVDAVTMKMGLPGEDEKLARIEHLAGVLQVPWTVVDMHKEFKQKVVDHFIHSYASGRTPNPCAQCNRDIKFKLLMDYALDNLGADFFATGHYADKIEIDGRFFLKKPADERKSQIYFLSLVGPERLQKVLFPIAALHIDQVRERVAGLPLGNQKESQDICFLQGEVLFDYLERHIPEKFRPGDFLDVAGNKIGTHRGAVYFTRGQRRGIGFASDRKLYVVHTDVTRNTVTLGENKHLYSRDLKIVEPVYWQEIKEGETYQVKVRYVGNYTDALVTRVSEGHIEAVLTQPTRAVTPGQIAAFYRGDIIVVGGYIG